MHKSNIIRTFSWILKGLATSQPKGTPENTSNSFTFHMGKLRPRKKRALVKVMQLGLRKQRGTFQWASTPVGCVTPDMLLNLSGPWTLLHIG